MDLNRPHASLPDSPASGNKIEIPQSLQKETIEKIKSILSLVDYNESASFNDLTDVDIPTLELILNTRYIDEIHFPNVTTMTPETFAFLCDNFRFVYLPKIQDITEEMLDAWAPYAHQADAEDRHLYLDGLVSIPSALRKEMQKCADDNYKNRLNFGTLSLKGLHADQLTKEDITALLAYASPTHSGRGKYSYHILVNKDVAELLRPLHEDERRIDSYFKWSW